MTTENTREQKDMRRLYGVLLTRSDKALSNEDSAKLKSYIKESNDFRKAINSARIARQERITLAFNRNRNEDAVKHYINDIIEKDPVGAYEKMLNIHSVQCNGKREKGTTQERFKELQKDPLFSTAIDFARKAHNSDCKMGELHEKRITRTTSALTRVFAKNPLTNG